LCRGRISAADEQTREYFDRLLAETGDARRELEERFDKNTDRLHTILDRHSKQLDDLVAEIDPSARRDHDA